MTVLELMILFLGSIVGILILKKNYYKLKSLFGECKKLKNQLNIAIENNSEQIEEFGGVFKIKILAIKNLISN